MDGSQSKYSEVIMTGDKPVPNEQALQREKAANQAEVAKQAGALADAALAKMRFAQKPPSLSQTFMDAAAVGGATKDHPGDGVVRAVDIPKAREQFGIPKPRLPGNEYGGWKDHLGKPVDFFRGDAMREQPEGIKAAGTMRGDKLLKTLADNRTWKEKPGGKKPEKSKPEFFKMLTQLSQHADSAAGQFDRLKAIGKPADVALTLSIMGREGRNGITSDPKKIDSYRHFGLDDLYSDQSALKANGYLPDDFPKLKKGDGGSWPAKWEGKVYNEAGQLNASVKERVVTLTGLGKTIGEAFDFIEHNILPKTTMGKNLGPEGLSKLVGKYRQKTTNEDVTLWRQTLARETPKAPGLRADERWRALLPLESNHEVHPASVPGDRMIEVTGAKLNQCRDNFHRDAKKAGFTSAEIDGASVDVHRGWTAMELMAPGETKRLLTEIKQGKNKDGMTKLDDIFTGKTNNDYIMGARVRAAEAHLIDKLVLQDPLSRK